MSDLVGNPEDQFSHNEAHIFSGILHGTGLSQPPKPRCENGSIASEGHCGQTKYAQ